MREAQGVGGNGRISVDFWGENIGSRDEIPCGFSGLPKSPERKRRLFGIILGQSPWPSERKNSFSTD